METRNMSNAISIIARPAVAAALLLTLAALGTTRPAHRATTVATGGHYLCYNCRMA
jgi:uncharacterized membrane protein